MNLVIHIPSWWPWALACVVCFVAGAIAGLMLMAGWFARSLVRFFDW